MSACWCPAFEPHAFKGNKCRNCHHEKSKHNDAGCQFIISTARDSIDGLRPSSIAAHDKQHRAMVAQELVQTERTYLAALQKTATDFVAPAREASALSKEEMLAVFSNVESLVALHTEMLAKLEAQLATCESGEDLAGFGQVFVKLGPLLRMYKEYSNNYSEAMRMVEATCKNKPQWLDICRKSIGSPKAEVNSVVMHVSSYLIQPIQRIPRYVLLLTDMLKHTPEAHDDHRQLKSALLLLNEIAAEVNQYMKRAEQGSRALQLQQHLIGKVPSLLEAHRSYVMEGEFHKITSRFVRGCTLFLFTDLLLYAHTRVGTFYKLQGTIDLGPTWSRALEDTQDFQNIMQIIGPKKTWTFYAPDAQTRDKWVTEITRLSDKIADRDPSVKERRAQVNVKIRTGLFKGRSEAQRAKFDKHFAQRIKDDEKSPLLSPSERARKKAKSGQCCCTIL